MSEYRHFTFSCHTERHKHIIDLLDSLESNNRSEFIRRAIEFYSGYLANKEENNAEIANQAFLRVIQLEKKLAELERKDEERYQRILEFIQEEYEESRKEREELRKELELIKKAQETLKREEEQKKEEGEPDDEDIVGYYVYNGRRIPIQAYRAKAYVEFITKHYDLFKVRPEAMIKRFMSEHGWHNDGVLAFVVKKYFPELEVYFPKIRDFEVVLNA